MRTLIQGGWIVGFDGAHHELIRDGVVVYEDDRVIHVDKDFDDQVDRTIDARGKLVSPGFVNCHLHAGTNAPHVFMADHLKSDYFASNFIAYAAGKRGAQDARSMSRTDVEQKFGIWAAIRGGATTVMDVGTRNPEAFVDMVDALGARMYMGPGFRSFEYAFDEDGRVHWDDNQAAGMKGLERAVAFAQEFNGAVNDRIRCMLFPGQLDTCSDELLRATRRAADEHSLRISLHVAMNMVEFQRVMREYRLTPIEYVQSIGFLGPDVILGHCVFHNKHSWAHYPYTDDIKILADSGATVAHAPYKYAKMGVMLESLARYRDAGINVAMGTDTYPEDMIHEMRVAGMMCRFADGSFRVGTPHDVFDCATLGGAKFLGREDLGRLAPGSKADLLIIDQTRLHYGAVRDPIKSLIECGSQQDIVTIVVDGKTLLDDGQPQTVDEGALLQAVQESGQAVWDSVPSWHWKGAEVDEFVPMSYSVR